MSERVRADHPSVETVRATVVRAGGTRRPELRLPADAAGRFPDGEVVRFAVGGDERHARIDVRDGEPVVRGAYDTARLARSPGGGTNRLAEWIRREDVGFDRSVLVDVVVEGFLYGVRTPGATAVYEAREPPAEGLRRIAEDIEE